MSEVRIVKQELEYDPTKKLKSESTIKVNQEQEFDVDQKQEISFEGREDPLALKIRKRERAFVGLFSKNKHLLDYNWSSLDSQDQQQFLIKTMIDQEQIKTKIDESEEDCIVVGAVKSKKQLIQESIFQGLNLPEEKIKFEELQQDKKIKREDAPEDFNQNDIIVEYLLQLQKGYELYNDKGRGIACRRAINYIRELDFQIRGPEDIFDIKMIGKKMKQSIIEILDTGRLKKAQGITQFVNNSTINSFSQLYGMGLRQAAMLQQQGMKNFTDLRLNQHLLNKTQQNSLKHYEINNMRIPRRECEQIICMIKQYVEEISDQKGIFEVAPCGSYRRGAQDSEDVIIILTRNDGKQCDWFMKRLSRYLEKKVIKEQQSAPSVNSYGSENYVGIIQLSPDLPHRKVELKYYPLNQFGYAVLYHTGPDVFLDSIRKVAEQKGMVFRDFGMFVKVEGSRINLKDEIIPCKTEEEVFKLIDLDYVRPENRNI